VLPTNRFGDLAPRLFLVATQLNGARKVVFGPTDSLGDDGYDDGCAYYDNVPISEALAAAVSLPPLFAPYAIVNPASGKSFHYYDGEVREPLSVHVARDAGADFAVTSSIWLPLTFKRDVGSLGDFGMVTVAEQALHQAFEQRVRRDRERAAELDQLLDMVAEHGRKQGWDDAGVEALQRDMCVHLKHRRTRTLNVTPDPTDSEFFFQSSFRFERKVIERCVDAGARAYERAVRESPEFLPALDRALRTATPTG
jgi:predicted acylesterase/phospholipase RssA